MSLAFVHFRGLEKSMKTIVAFFALLLLHLAAPAFAQQQIDAPTALSKAQAGGLVLIDIRTHGEWKETGIASVATPLSMQEDPFLDGLAKIRAENPGKPIALICATGGRTAWLQRELTKRGLGDTLDVSEGMLGNGQSPGWIARGLPLKKVE